MKRYETTRETPIVNAILDLLVKNDYLVESGHAVVVARPKPTAEQTAGADHRLKQGLTNTWSDIATQFKIEPEDNVPCNQYIGNHLPIETNLESMARDFLGVCEDRKLWKNELKAAVKEHGHDEVLNAFYEWASSQGNFIGRKPVTMFLKNAGSYVTRVNKPQVTSPVLDRIEQRIAYITDNKVFFTGDYRLRLSLLAKEHGHELVEAAFADFYQNVDDRGLPWAARDFLQRADVMIKTIKMKREEVSRQQALVASNYAAAAQAAVEEDEEEEDRSL